MSLSDPRVIELLQRYFVAATIDDCEYFHPIPHELPVGLAAQDPSTVEREELDRIRREAKALSPTLPRENLPRGPVVVYVLSPDGHVVDVMDQVIAEKPDLLVTQLRSVIARLGTKRGPALGTYVADPRPAPSDGLRVHVVSRFLDPEGQQSDFLLSNRIKAPAYYWITFPEPARLLPESAAAGQSWTIDPAVAATLLMHTSPPTETYHLSASRVERVSLSATVESVANGVVTARLQGTLRMRHPWWHDEKDGCFVEETLAGTLAFDAATRRIVDLALVTEDGTYTNGTDFRIATASALTTR